MNPLRIHVISDRAKDLLGDGSDIQPARHAAKLMRSGPNKEFSSAAIIDRCELPALGPRYPQHPGHHHATKEEAIDCGEAIVLEQVFPALFQAYGGSCEYWLQLHHVTSYRWFPEEHRPEIEAFAARFQESLR